MSPFNRRKIIESECGFILLMRGIIFLISIDNTWFSWFIVFLINVAGDWLRFPTYFNRHMSIKLLWRRVMAMNNDIGVYWFRRMNVLVKNDSLMTM